MNIETVNELIQSLESAGELSIKESKYLDLAKEFRICSASLDAAIKTGNVLADQNAQLAAENAELKSSRAVLAENTLESCNSIACAGFRHEAIMRGLYASTGNGNKYPKPITTLVDEAMRKLETPATDRIYAGIKADGVEEFAKYISLYSSNSERHAIDFAKQLREGVK
ncbi:hypothetical protein POX30_01280 [Raoultella planticola]|uniref:hypothetical protein n=1 Tax=Raoultella planticola TaxID=575 RepID=UPI002FFABDF9